MSAHEMYNMYNRLGQLAASMITQTQILTVTMVLLLISYSVPLLAYVARINDTFDKMGNLLLGQKELHRMNMARREKQKPPRVGSKTEGEAEAEDGMAVTERKVKMVMTKAK